MYLSTQKRHDQLDLLIRSTGKIWFWRIIYSLDQNTLRLTQGCCHHQWYYITTYHTPQRHQTRMSTLSVIICIIYRTVGRCNTTKWENYWYHNPQYNPQDQPLCRRCIVIPTESNQINPGSYWTHWQTVPEKIIVAWVQIDLKCPSNIFQINHFLQEMAHFNPNSFWNNVLVQNETVENFCKDKSLVALSYDAPNSRLEHHLWPIIEQSILGCV